MTMLFQKGEGMATNILLVNQKGGVGKTTFADEIAWGLERRGHKVGFGNLDPQGGANHEKNLLDDENAVNVIDTPGFLVTRRPRTRKTPTSRSSRSSQAPSA